MQRLTPSRNAISAAPQGAAALRVCVILLAAIFTVTAQAQDQDSFQRQGGGREHIGPWLASHQNLSPEEQQRALAAEPGFSTLPPPQQQRMEQRLNQLNSMPPEQRQRTIDHIEAMERLTPEQRQQLRGAMSELGSLPPDRRRVVARSFHELRTMPPDQRTQLMNSPDFQHQFSDQERGTLNDLMAIDPYLPPPEPWH